MVEGKQPPQKVFNINIGVLGHIDSGKTSLVKVLSTELSTAALDKHPQSQERGITLDLGFSCFKIPMPEHLNQQALQLYDQSYDFLQFTLVDCPGHASLIQTILAGAQIIDMMLLVIDGTKGIQTQTAECIVIAELLLKSKNLIVVINKIDLIDEAQLQKVNEKVQKMLGATPFASVLKMVNVAACPKDQVPVNIESLVQIIQSTIEQLPPRNDQGPLYMPVDHCFPVKGQGTVLTGTILQGKLQVGDQICIAGFENKRVKSMQMFHKGVQSARQGDRVGICVTQFDPKLVERGIVCTPGLVQKVQSFIIDFNLIKYYKRQICSKQKYHITCGSETVMGTIILFSGTSGQTQYNPSQDYPFQEAINPKEKLSIFAWITLEQAILCKTDAIIIGSKLDTEINLNLCRIAFSGKIQEIVQTEVFPTYIGYPSPPRIFKTKSKAGVVERIHDQNTCIVKDMFKKGSDISKFIGLTVQLQNQKVGKIEDSFGKSGKFKVVFYSGVDEGDKGQQATLNFKKFLYDKSKALLQ